MKKNLVFICLCVFVLTLPCISVLGQEVEGVDEVSGESYPLLVIPVRHTIVKLAFDVNSLRKVSLVSCTVDKETGKILVHLWNNITREWVGITIDEYKAGAVFSIAPEKVFLIGSEDGVPAELGDVSGWGKTEVVEIPKLSIASIINTLNKDMNFSSKEWKWLAGRYNLVLKDLNSERRRYGRYGRPDTKKEKDVEPPEMMMPPADLEIENVPAAPPMMEEEKPAPPEEVKDIIAEEKPAPVEVPAVKDASEEDIPPEDK